MEGRHTDGGPCRVSHPSLVAESPPMSHKRYLVELNSEERNVPEAVDVLRLAQDPAPAAGPDLAALRPGAGGPGLDRRAGGGRGRDRP